MKKIFFMCTHCNQGTGYGRVANMITNHLAKTHEVVYYAFQGYKGQEVADRFIDPRIKFIDALELDSESPKGFGYKGILPSLEQEKPDYLFLYNDINACYSILNMVLPCSFKVVLYVDLVYPWEDVDKIKWLRKQSDQFYIFSQFWKDHLEQMGVSSDVLYHGVDTHRPIIDTITAKQELGFDENDFLVLNLNRNSYRKQLPITIKAFLTFLKRHQCNSHIKLYLSCILHNKDGYTIRRIIHTECVRRNLDTSMICNNHIFINSRPTAMPESFIDTLYNASDVGMNTCLGEGFGLTTLEHALMDKPQIITATPSLVETLGPVALVVEPRVWMTVNNQESHGGELAVTEPDDFVEALEKVYRGEHTGKGYRDHVVANWSWNDKLKVLDGYFLKDDENLHGR